MSSRVIKQKIGSIRNTQKITKAMQMVAASKMRKAQEKMMSARPYAERVMQVIHHLSQAHPEYRHPFMMEREFKKVGYLVISTDRGLCGSLNMSLLRDILKDLKNWKNKNVEQELCLIGTKAGVFFRRYGFNISAGTSSNESMKLEHLIGVIKVMLDKYRQGEIDALFVCSNEFINTMVQRPNIQQLLPIVPPNLGERKKYWDYIYESDAKELLHVLLERYIESMIYERVLENNACEQSARMVSMKSATDNAGEVIARLQLDFNKARQSAITQEIADIVGGAAAIES